MWESVLGRCLCLSEERVREMKAVFYHLGSCFLVMHLINSCRQDQLIQRFVYKTTKIQLVNMTKTAAFTIWSFGQLDTYSFSKNKNCIKDRLKSICSNHSGLRQKQKLKVSILVSPSNITYKTSTGPSDCKDFGETSITLEKRKK